MAHRLEPAAADRPAASGAPRAPSGDAPADAAGDRRSSRTPPAEQSASAQVGSDSMVRGRLHPGAVHGAHALTRPLPFAHPTRAVFAPLPSAKAALLGGAEPVGCSWSARASRKNRYARRPLRVAPHHALAAHHEGKVFGEALEARSQVALVEQRLRRPSTRLKVHLAWDLAFWVALVFVVGSALWVRASSPPDASSNVHAAHARRRYVLDCQRVSSLRAARRRHVGPARSGRMVRVRRRDVI